jgi:hypothetical protein
MNSRTKRKLAYGAKNEKAATVRNLTLADKIFIDINDEFYNHKDIDRLQNANRNSRIRNSYAGGITSTIGSRKYACGVQKLRKARKSA